MRARFRLTPLLTALSLAAPGAWAGGLTVVAVTGQAAPGLSGVSFDVIYSQTLDDAGRVSFAANLTGAGVGTDNETSIWRGNVLQRREGQAAPGLPAGTLLGDLILRGTTPGGALNYESRLTGAGVVPATSRALWRDATALLRTGDPAPGTGATFAGFDVTANDAQGVPLIRASLTGSGVTGANDDSLWMGGVLRAREGSTAPGAGSAVFSGSSPFGFLTAAGNGQYAFRATLAGTDVTSANDVGIWRNSGLVVREGQAAPGLAAGTTIASLDNNGALRTVNADGRVLYWAQTTGTVATSGLWLDNNPVVLAGTATPGLAGATFRSFGYHTLNDAGHVAFAATTSTGRNGLWRDGQAIVIAGDVLADGAEVSNVGLSPFASPPVLAAGGQVLAPVSLVGGGNAVLLGDGTELVTVLRSGDAVAGRTVSFAYGSQVNRHGQVAWSATLDNGETAVGLWTPDLRWRGGGSGSWDQAANWTLSLAPGQPHAVRIDPGVALTVTGPAGAAAVDSLVIGSGTGFATLRLGGGRIDSAQGVTIAAKGILTGSGTIGSLVRNQGEVRADSLVLSAGLLNEGFVSGSTSGGQRIDAALTNTAGGWVQVRPGERLLLSGPSHENLGTFDLQGGELQLRGRLKNSAGGRILMDDARLYAFDGIENAGQIQVTFGESEVFGNILTTGTGKILLSGNSQTTFYDALDVKSGGELRVSSGAAAVFFGAVQQRSGAVFSGTGQKYYEGGLSIGGSPGLGLDAGNVAFGAGNFYLAEIGGLAAGTEFDAYRVAGHLDFGGTLALVSWDGFTGQAGQRFDLFDWGSASGAFATIDADGFALAAGTALDLSRLYVDGSIAVVAVPEPGPWALMLGGALVLGWRRRRACGNPPTARGGA